jgi:hypothetical protein
VPDIALATLARSPIERLVAFERERSWKKDGGDEAAFNVLRRRDGKIRHFWGGAMKGASST